jgi:predicted PurR-regulated permease PerM
VIYSVGLSLAGLKYGMIIGLFTGLLAFIPIVGTVAGLIISMIMALVQFDAMAPIMGVLIVFIAAQLIDANFLTPKLVGDRVGLHPVWIMFAVLAGGKLLGPIGVIIGVPLVGTLAILLKVAMRQYKNSRYYLGQMPSQNNNEY